MIETIDPDKTTAIVVGIERYDYGKSWNLNGPASDAVRFVRWLRERQVPKERILLFLSPLAENENLAQTTDVVAQPATRDLLQHALAQRLNDDPAMAGDLLLLFWGGHGVMEADQTRRLFYANATEQNKLVLDVDSLWQMLRSKDRQHRFKYQIGIIDACANYFAEMRHKLSLADAGFSAGATDATVKQFVLYAAAAGERAKNEDIRRTGAFSEIVLDCLAQTPTDQWPPDMPELNQAAQARFEQLRLERKVSQTPVFFQWQDWTGSSGAVGEFKSGYERLSEVSLVRSWLSDVEIATAKLRQLYLRSAPEWQRAPAVENLDQMLERLWEMMPRAVNALLPLYEFAERVARACSLDELSDKVIAAVQQRGGAMNQVSDLRARIAEEQKAKGAAYDCYLLIDACDRDLLTKELRFPTELRYWVVTHDNPFGNPGVVNCANATPAAVRAAILDIVAQVESNYGRPFVELFVHHNWLGCDADQWEKTDDLLTALFAEAEENHTRLGDSCHVVLRWGNRAMECGGADNVIKPTRPALWQKLVTAIRGNPASCTQPDVWWIDHALKPQALAAKYSSGNAAPCTGFSFVPFDPATAKVERLLMAALVNGAAFALWPRCAPANEQNFRQLLCNAVQSGALEQLPQQIRELRLKALNDPQHPGGALTLFWDDPERNPLVIQNTQPD